MPTVRLGRFVVTGTDTQIGDVAAALAACAFLVAEELPRDIPVRYTDLSSYGAAGLFWTDGRIEIDQRLTGVRAQAIFLAEAWHAIDQYLLTSADRAAMLTAAHGAESDGHTWFDNESYYADLGETMMDVFLAAYTPYPPTGIDWQHGVTPRLVDTLRSILQPEPEPPVDPLAGFPHLELDAWAARARPWWARYSRRAATAYKTWRGL